MPAMDSVPGGSDVPAATGALEQTPGSAGDGLLPTGRAGDDRSLAARLASGDEAALADAYRRYGHLVYSVARRVLRDEPMAEDVTQEVFTYLWEHPERFDPARGSLKAWVGLLAHRRSVDRVRAETRRTRSEARTIEPDAAQPAPEQEVDAEWMCTRVRMAVDSLPPEQRQVLVCAYYGGRTYRQVAEELTIPEGTAKSRIRLALARLNEILSAEISDAEVPAWT
jgi:RNA polymerase sigma-70 factor (ECF subfamily)